MTMKITHLFSLLIIGLVFMSMTSSSNVTYSLFHIGRSKDANIIKYDIHLNDGKLDLTNPIKVYWIKNTDGGKVEGLTYTQQKLAYGVKYLSKKADEVKFQFVSYSKRNFYLKKVNGDRFKVITYLDKKGVEVKRIHVQIDGGTFMLPQISYVLLFWRDPFKGDEGVEIIKP